MIGKTSLGISLEKGRSLVPMPPAVMSALYWASRAEGLGSSGGRAVSYHTSRPRPKRELAVWSFNPLHRGFLLVLECLEPRLWTGLQGRKASTDSTFDPLEVA